MDRTEAARALRITVTTVGELQDALARFARSIPVALADDRFVAVEAGANGTIVYLTDDPEPVNTCGRCGNEYPADHELCDCDELRVTVGRNDGTVPVRRFRTLAEGEAYVAALPDTDAVERGDYYIDAPEDLLNG